MSVETITLGCRLNFAESEAMARQMPAGQDWVIVNSCAVTSEAVRQTRQAIRRARREHPNAKVLAAGCAVQLEPERFRSMPEVDEVRTRDFAAPLTVPAGAHARVRSFVGIQTGCDHRCTFCSIWQARGPSRSLPFEAIRSAVAREIDRGAKEIVLTGVDITDYAGGLGSLCRRLLDAEQHQQADEGGEPGGLGPPGSGLTHGGLGVGVHRWPPCVRCGGSHILSRMPGRGRFKAARVRCRVRAGAR